MFTVEVIFAGLLMFHCPAGIAECSAAGISTDMDVLFVNTSETSLACHRPYCQTENGVSTLRCGDEQAPVCTSGEAVCQGSGVICDQGQLRCAGGGRPCPSGDLICETPPDRCSALDNTELTPHFPRLAFDLRYLKQAHVPYTVVLDSVGRELAVYEPETMCLTWMTGDDGGVFLDPGYSPEDRRPTEEEAGYGWISAVREFDREVGDIRSEILSDDPMEWEKWVTVKLKLDEGVLTSTDFPSKNGQLQTWRACPDRRPLATASNLVRALPEKVLLKHGPLAEGTPVVLQTCGDEPQALFEFQAADGMIKLEWTNLPMASHTLEPHHFRWYYELVEYGPGHAEALPIPKKAAEDDSASYQCAAPGGSGQFCPPTTYP